MPQSAKLPRESSTSSAKRLAPGKRLPNGKLVVESWINRQPNAVKLKADPQTGEVTPYLSDPATRAAVERQKSSQAKR